VRKNISRKDAKIDEAAKKEDLPCGFVDPGDFA